MIISTSRTQRVARYFGQKVKIGDEIFDLTPSIFHQVIIDEGQLLLYPLGSISRDQAEQAAACVGITNITEFQNNGKQVTVGDEDAYLEIFFDGRINHYNDNANYHLKDTLFNYLRSQGYDMDGMIESGEAVDAALLNIEQPNCEILSYRIHNSNPSQIVDKDHADWGDDHSGDDVFSLRRLSDGSIFTIGDNPVKIENGAPTMMHIVAFEYSKVNVKRMGVWSSDLRFYLLEDLTPAAIPLFHTTDGRPAYHGMQVWKLTNNAGAWSLSPVVLDRARYDLPSTCHYFSTKQLATIFINQHVPLFSYSDLIGKININGDDKKVLMALAEQRAGYKIFD